jgi:hypothetical protein
MPSSLIPVKGILEKAENSEDLKKSARYDEEEFD